MSISTAFLSRSLAGAHSRGTTAWTWIRSNLFNSPLSALMTLLIVWALASIIPALANWALTHAVWRSTADASACRVEGAGACWAVIGQKYRFILFGFYPYEQQWRPMVAILIVTILLLASVLPGFLNQRFVLPLLGVSGVLIAVLMWGGVFGLAYVSHNQWSGLPLTLVLSIVGILFAFPIGILSALGRQSQLPIARALCVIYIELIRGVPLISLLFVSILIFPLILPPDISVNNVLRVLVAIALFNGAYVAEALRGSLRALPSGQHEAAAALGLLYWPKMLLVILPQATRNAIPSLVNQFIETFKDTSLVIVVGLYDFLTTTKTVTADPVWSPFYVESYLFAAVVYFAFTFFMSRYGLLLERRLKNRGPA